MGSEEAMQRYLAAERALINQLVDAATQPAVKEFTATIAERQRLQSETLEANKRIAAMQNARIRPVCDLVFGIVDDWLKEALKQGIATEQPIVEEFNPVTIGTFKDNGNIRRLSFTSKHVFNIWARSAKIDDGSWADSAILIFYLTPPDGSADTIWYVNIEEKDVLISNPNSKKFLFKGYKTEADIPISDNEFIKSVTKSLNEVMANVLFTAKSASSNQSPPTPSATK